MTCKQKIPIEKRQAVYDKNHGYCAICGEKIPFQHFSIDHIIPLSRGGSNLIDNMQPACYVCNQMKHNMETDAFMKKVWEIAFYSRTKVFSNIR